jgi:small GTP-binding protein
VRNEILEALDSGIRVVPVLVDGCEMPQKSDLPSSLGRLTRLNAIKVTEDHFEEAMEKLLALIGRRVDAQQEEYIGDERMRLGDRAILQRKICLLGLAGVGKTSLVQSYVYSIFSDSYLTTVGVKIDKKIVRVRDQVVTLMIWDVAGEEDGSPIRTTMVQGASGLIFVADGCRARSLEAAVGMRHRFSQGDIPAVLAVNKVDLLTEWQVDINSLSNLGYSGLTTFTTSAKTGKGVEEMFSYLARRIVDREN